MAYDAYIISTDYSGTYKGAPIAAADFDRFALRASDAIDKMTSQRIRTAGLASFDAETQDLIKRATCAMAEGLYQVDQATGGTGIVASSEKIGSYSYNLAQDAVNQRYLDASVQALDYLATTGLLYSGLGSV